MTFSACRDRKDRYFWVFVIIIWEAKPCIFLSFIVLWLVQPTTKYDFATVEGYQEGNAKIKISIKKKQNGVVVIFGRP